MTDSERPPSVPTFPWTYVKIGRRTVSVSHPTPGRFYGIRPSDGTVVFGITLEDAVRRSEEDPRAGRPPSRPSPRKRPTGRS